MDMITRRHAEFLAARANGDGRTDVARSFCLSEFTVDNALKEARVRLEASSLMQAIFIAIALELLVLDHEGKVSVSSDEVIWDDRQWRKHFQLAAA